MAAPTQYGATDDSSASIRNEKVTVSEEQRMWLNGESAGQMEHAKKIKAAGGVSLDPADGNDTSVDQKWTYDESQLGNFKDGYVLFCTCLWIMIKGIFLFLPMLLFHLLPILVCRLYISSLPDLTERLHRSCYFYLAFTMAFLFAIPAIVLIFISLMLDYVMYYIFSVLFCLCTWRWSEMWASQKMIDPYRNGPSTLLHLPDLFAAICGQCGRQTCMEDLWMVSVMWLLMPWLKYFVCCNPYIYDLNHRLCQQISTTMADVGTDEEVADIARIIISRARQRREIAKRLDIWSFVPHYPYPPPDRRWAIGLQCGGGDYPGKFSLIVHVTHAISTAGSSTEQFVLSNTCSHPIYRVMLWYSNPFHFLTGWVEASVSTGGDSQSVKNKGGEHPMWLVSGHTSQTSGRDSFTGSGMIDAFFDYWLPVFVHQVRLLKHYNQYGDMKKAVEYADSKYEEVVSKDGASESTGSIGMDKYDREKTTLGQFDHIAHEQNKDCGQQCGLCLAHWAETPSGKAIAAMQQGTDLHGSESSAPTIRLTENSAPTESAAPEGEAKV
eukprot:gnl/TRDRNA2_/TRDRNA2_178801_c0_seq1.p1 gnl/TRDRNA2_/TRDRNA2_178801_c0~~gnl/TRDRNA2_/TRDRNA2_178801_c0_seq1.p1  ORF type:complete len:552 (-),score=94.02 gnl/TRDRNA2_/TRDRNA2_178801_c0_seq1:16-1671(-)